MAVVKYKFLRFIDTIFRIGYKCRVKSKKRKMYVSSVPFSHIRSLVNQSGLLSIAVGRVAKNVS